MCIKIVEIYCSGKKISPLVGRRGHGLGRRRIMSNFFLYCVHLVYFLRNSTEFCVNRTEFQRIHFHFLLLIFSSFLQSLRLCPLLLNSFLAAKRPWRSPNPPPPPPPALLLFSFQLKYSLSRRVIYTGRIGVT